ncbi:hypothetical protein [Winogradskyella sp.]|uniref:hypothetical protein n=1 Tax=Winogradskyella sp. TaxID=1883156 RepID=UPI003AB824DC
MAKQKGLVPLEGTLKGINFYYRKGVPIARAAGGGFTRAAIKHSPTMERVRESNTEFAGCSKINKVFKQALAPFLKGHKDGILHSRLMSLFLGIKNLDRISGPGKRQVALGIETRQGVRLFNDFKVTPERPRLLACDYGLAWEEGVFFIEGIDSGVFMKGCDVIVLSVGLVRFDFDSLAFEQVFADPLLVRRSADALDYRIVLPVLAYGTGAVFGVGQVQFYQEIDGALYDMRKGFGVELFMEV